MVTTFASVLSATIDRFVRLAIIPLTGIIPYLVSSGLLFIGFAGLWTAFLVAMVRDPNALDAAWAALGGLALPLQAVAWLLFLPLTAGLWVWSTDWPLIARVLVVMGIAGWNLVVFLPRRAAAPAASD